MSKASNLWNKTHKKECAAASKRWRDSHPDKCKELRREWKSTAKIKGTLNVGNKSEQMKRYRKRYPKECYARTLLWKAVKNGEIKRPENCQMCGEIPKNKVHGHHSDYSKPLEVFWVCYKCHNSIHRSK